MGGRWVTVLLEGAILALAPADGSGSLLSPGSVIGGSLGACATSLAFFQAVMKGVPSSPHPPALLQVPASAGCLAWFRRPRCPDHADRPWTSGGDSRVGIALCWPLELISRPSAASHGGAEAVSEPVSLGGEMGLLSPVQPTRVPAGHRN